MSKSKTQKLEELKAIGYVISDDGELDKEEILDDALDMAQALIGHVVDKCGTGSDILIALRDILPKFACNYSRREFIIAVSLLIKIFDVPDAFSDFMFTSLNKKKVANMYIDEFLDSINEIVKAHFRAIGQVKADKIIEARFSGK